MGLQSGNQLSLQGVEERIVRQLIGGRSGVRPFLAGLDGQALSFGLFEKDVVERRSTGGPREFDAVPELFA